jgi:hypothetical protein
MKKIWLVLLVAVMAFGVAGCHRDYSRDADPVGRWTVAWDNGCDGSPFMMSMSIFDNGTFIDTEGDRGRWTIDGDNITLNYDTYPAVMTGVVNGNWMDGGFSGVRSGCWTAQRVSNSPTP